MTTKNKEMTIEECLQEIENAKIVDEANVVVSFYKEPELLLSHDYLTPKYFSESWRVFFIIIHELYVKQGMKTIDDIAVNLYVKKNRPVKTMFDKFGGYSTIAKSMPFVQVDNFESYMASLVKWNSLKELTDKGFNIAKDFNNLRKMSSQEIYDYYTFKLNTTFINQTSSSKAYKLSHNIDKLIDDLDEGAACGMDIYNLPLLTNALGGIRYGEVTGVFAASGGGKSSFIRNVMLPSILNSEDNAVVLLNEEGLEKFQREMMIYALNVVKEKNIQKHVLRNGAFDNELKTFLKKEVAQWFRDNEERIIIIPLETFTVNECIKFIRKFAVTGMYQHFVIDTYKADSTSSSDNIRIEMNNNMTKLYDLIKPRSLNVSLWCPAQLTSESNIKRKHTLFNIGEAKGMVNCMSSVISIRRFMADEYEGGKNEVKVFKLLPNGSKTSFAIKEGTHAQVIQVLKTREGDVDTAIVVEHDLSRNVIKELGFCIIKADF